MAKTYQQFKKDLAAIQQSFELPANTIKEWNEGDKKRYAELQLSLSKAKAAITKLKQTNLAQARKMQVEVRATASDVFGAKTTGKKVDVTPSLARLKKMLAEWHLAQLKLQAIAEPNAKAVRATLATWTEEKDPQALFDKIYGQQHRQMMADFETAVALEVKNRNKKLSTKLGVGNKSVGDMEKLLEDAAKFKKSTTYRSVAEWDFDLAQWKARKEKEISKDVLTWEPLDLTKWKANRISEVKSALKVTAFDF